MRCKVSRGYTWAKSDVSVLRSRFLVTYLLRRAVPSRQEDRNHFGETGQRNACEYRCKDWSGKRGEIMIRKMGKFALSAVAVLSITPLVCQAQSVMTHHVRDVVRTGAVQVSGTLPPSQVLQLDLVLPLSDAAGLDAFLSELYNPSSPSYRHFLSVQQFTARFGPTQAQYDAVVNYSTKNGLTVVGGTRDGMDVQVNGTVEAVEAAFHVTLHTYLDPTDNHTYFSVDSEPTTGLPFNLWHISGLDNLAKPYPMYLTRESYAKSHGIPLASVVIPPMTGSGPLGSFLGSDMRAAYYGNGPLTGAGQNLGLLELGGTDLADLQNYYQQVKQPYPGNPSSPCTSGGTCTSGIITLLQTNPMVSTYCVGKCHDVEQTFDMTQALGMAPGLASLTFYVGSGQDVSTILSAMVSHDPLPTTISSSWGGWGGVDSSIPNIYLDRMAAQGQTFFQASGDNSTWAPNNNDWPADDPYLVSVGATNLVTAGPAGPWQSETAWDCSGGGVSPNGIPIPSWQQIPGVINSSNKGSTTLRNGPDVSANGGFNFYVCANQISCSVGEYAGTSFAAPMWAAFTALNNEQLVATGRPMLGFIDPTIYAQNESNGALTPAYALFFHDITSGTSGSYSAVPGYDLVTGWGSPNGLNGFNKSVLVPAVVGLTEATASAAIVKVGLVPVVNKEPGCLNPGTVIYQMPSGGSLTQPGDGVIIMINIGPATKGKKCIPD
jgi:subtilase family serine protease